MQTDNNITLENKQYIASFDVDAQNTFTPLCANELPVPEGDKIVDALNAQAVLAQYRIGSKDAHSPKALWIANQEQPVFSTIQGENMDMRWPPHAIPGTLGFELLKGLPPITAYDYFVWKGIELDMHPYGACYHDFAERLSTGVIEFLRAKQIRTVLVGGLATDYCVKTTVLQLLRASFLVIVNLSACRAIDLRSEEQALKEMQQAGAIIVPTLNSLKVK